MKVNGTNYNIYTTGTSLPTIYAPTSLGTAGQVLKMNGDGTGFTWATDATIANTWRPVKALKSDGTALGTLSDNSTTLSLKAGSNITLAYSSGTITITGVGNTWTALGGATASADGTAGYAPKPTKGQQGYYLKGNATWVKPSLSEFTDDVVSGKYLPLSGGTLTGNITLGSASTTSHLSYYIIRNGNTIGLGSDYYNTCLRFSPSTGGTYFFKLSNSGMHYSADSGNTWNTVFHSGNDGTGSGLDADLLDGKHLSDILASNVASATKATYLKTQYSDSTSWYDNYLLYGKWATDNSSICDFKCDNYSVRVDIAKKLNTARTLWGQSFDGSGNVSGSLSGVTDIFMSGSITLVYGSTDYKSSISMKEGYLYIQPRQENVSYNYNTVLNSQGGNVGIGTTSPAYKLDVSDTMQVTSYITGLFINRTNPEGNPHVSFKSNGTLVGDIGFTPQKNLVFYDYNSGSWKDILNANNYTSYTVTKTGGGASGLWGINISGYSQYMNNTGNASNLNTPSAWTYDNHYLVYDLYSRNASNKPVDQDNANSAITLYKGWHGTSGAYATQIAFPNNEDIYIRKCSAGSWGSWRKLYHSGNFSATGTTWNGGTVSNTIYTTATPGMIVRRPDGAVPYIRFGHTNGTDYGELGSTASGTPVWWYTAGENSAWRELVSNVSGTAYNSTRWGGYTLSVSGTPSNSTITFYV